MIFEIWSEGWPGLINKELCGEMKMNLLNAIRSNKIASWFFALLMGLVFRYAYGSAKHLFSFWSRNWDFGTSTYPTPESQLLLLTVTFNIAVDFISSLMAAALCGVLLVYIFRERAGLFTLGSVFVFLLMSSRLWRFWKYPELGMQISSLVGPLLAGFVFVSTVWLLWKIRERITLG